jgi:hypothetical protein
VAKKGWILLLGLVIIYSCAKVTVSPVDNDRPYTQGIRFYRSHPYLLVTDLRAKSFTFPKRRKSTSFRFNPV